LADSKSDSIIDGHFATNPAVIPLDNALWQYACQVYSQAGVEATLLNLQDEQGADINLILQALWLANKGIEWTSACIPHDYNKWVEEQVIPIRTMRRRLKTDWVGLHGEGYEDFRQQVKKLELKAEQYALAMLFVQSEAKTNRFREKDKKGSAFLAEKNLKQLGENMNILPEYFELLVAAL
jgi:uncharacterized protein (TIGR02444 family)